LLLLSKGDTTTVVSVSRLVDRRLVNSKRTQDGRKHHQPRN
jgi:hypothetical protein